MVGESTGRAMIWSTVLGFLAGGIGGWVVTHFVGSPLLEFNKLRRAIVRARLDALHETVDLRVRLFPRDDGVVDRPDPLQKVKSGLHDAGHEMIAFGQATPAARVAFKVVGFDTDKIGHAAMTYANALDGPIERRASCDRELRAALKIT